MPKKITSVIITTLLVVSIVLLCLPLPVQAVPQPPHRFRGDAFVGGAAAPDNATVTAAIAGATFPYTPTAKTSAGRYGDDLPLFKVPADDPDTSLKEGGVDGDTIHFYIEGVAAGTYTFTAGGSTELALSISALPTLVKPTGINRTTPDNDNTPTFTWSTVTGAVSYEVRIDTTAFSNIGNVTTYTFATITDGTHTFEVRAIDFTGNPGPSSDLYSFTIDATPPVVTIIPLTPDPTTDNTPTLSGAATDATTTIASVAYRVDSGSWTAATSVDGAFDEASEGYTFTTSTLADGSHTVEVRATDAAGNVTALANYASDTFTVSTAVPFVPGVPAVVTLTAETIGTMTNEQAAAALGALTSGQGAAILAEVAADRVGGILGIMAADKAGSILGEMTDAKAGSILGTVTDAKAGSILATMANDKAGSILGTMTDAKAGSILATMTNDKAGSILATMTADKAGSILGTMTNDKAGSVLATMTNDKAGSILATMADDKAGSILATMTNAKAGSVLATMTNDKAGSILGTMTDAKAGSILENVEMKKAAAIMEKLTTDKLTGVIPGMSEASLTERLPWLSPDKLYSVKPDVLFRSLPHAPTEQLISEDPPQPPAEATAPVVVYTTPSGARYLAVKTWAEEWVVVMGTPVPVDKLLIKTKQALQNVETTMEVYEKQPPEVAASLPAGQIARAYLNISFKNATPEDIELGHITFKLEKAWIEQNSIHKWSVVLNWYDPELKQWNSLPTKRVEEDDTYVYYTAVISHFSIFAISGSQVLPPADFGVANLTINPAKAETGEAITISADVTNLSGSAVRHTVTLWIDGTVEAGRNISLNAGETKPVSFMVTRDAEGDYEVRVDRLFGSFSVTKVVTPPVTPPVKPPVKPINWWLIGGIIVGCVIIGMVIWLIVRRQRA